MTDLSRSIAVKPIIKYPREAQVGKTYLITIDLQPEEYFEWQYEEEEYPVYCSVDSDLFTSKPVGEPIIVMHRFGGSYGEAKFLLTALKEIAESHIRVMLTNRWGIPVSNVYLEISTVSVLADQTLLEIESPVAEFVNRANKKSQNASNQTIGQVLGRVIVYGSGGQAVINAETKEQESEEESVVPIIGSNPYKGLMAFQENDGDRFFGREKQIAVLWEKLRNLHETESAIRVLPIYGPSGSGKSSLVRAGLIPALARRPIPGYDQAKVVVLMPGPHPLQSLAALLATILPQDLPPVAKTHEFERVLKRVNEFGEYDGLRRIANVIPNIEIAPLVVLVDQFEEVYTLCSDNTERDAFIGNLLHASGHHSPQVSVILTLRSEFLGEIQRHLVLSRLFAEQGFLVPPLNTDELRQAIAYPAKRAGYAFDLATIDLLVKETEGRAGALPLLQFALTVVWEELAKGKHPVETLRRMGGIAGYAAGEAQRIYDNLSPIEQEIARRVFLGLVQVGEGTMNSRRRTEIQNLISYRDNLEQVRNVINRFANPGARLITCSSDSTGGTTVEITHEALIRSWQQLNHWIEESLADVRFQRRVEDAATWWDQNGRPDGSLWRSPDLEFLEAYYERAGDNMTQLTLEFLKASQQLKRKRRWWPF